MGETGTEAQATRKPHGKVRWGVGLTLFFTAVSAAAGAGAAVAAWMSVEQQRDVRLLDKRVDACFDLSRRAAMALGGAIKTLPSSYQLYDSSGGYYSDDPMPCEGAPEQKKVCEAAKAKQEELERQSAAAIARAAAYVSSMTELVDFEAARTFDLIGPPALAKAEDRMATALDLVRKVSQSKVFLSLDDRPQIDAAADAIVAFRKRCAESVAAPAL